MGDGQQVFSLPPLDEPARWDIEKLDDGYYKMRVGGNETAEQNGRVHALIHDKADAENWVIRPYDRKGPNVYTIEKLDGSEGWVMLASEPFAPISVQQLPETKNLPTRYLPPCLFEITKVDEE
ncbi:hypothetical protein H072_7305 [Dactylellina haptotyla CBS 200.50]|uniref:Ricin B lectin domain-containing protein n=1 Tax=Dactylellina haptotyla (strain CBS 200.50) TaxID=1284197 RepID=S8ACW5_DACHA|nr:hypothetical protein H072_7305 [Dactylellina haptotyla CBS 200.50]